MKGALHSSYVVYQFEMDVEWNILDTFFPIAATLSEEDAKNLVKGSTLRFYEKEYKRIE